MKYIKKGLMILPLALLAAKEIYFIKSHVEMKKRLDETNKDLGSYIRCQLKINETLKDDVENIKDEISSVYEHMEEIAKVLR